MIVAQGNRLSHIANGQINTDAKMALAERLVVLDRALVDVILAHQPQSAAVEEVFVNVNPQSTLKLGQARGVILLAAAKSGIAIGEYSARLIKKSSGGHGRRGQGSNPCDGGAAAARCQNFRRGCRRCACGCDHARASYRFA